jgi:hypothetical protein
VPEPQPLSDGVCEGEVEEHWLDEEVREGVREALPHNVAETQPECVGLVLDDTEVVCERLGVPVGVANCVEGAGEGLTVTLPDCVEQAEAEEVCD